MDFLHEFWYFKRVHWNTMGLDCWVFWSPFDFMPKASASSPHSTTSSNVWSLPRRTWGGKRKLILSCAEVLHKVSLKKVWHIHVHSSINYNRQKVKATRMSINWWMDKQDVIYTHNGTLFNFKKEGNSDTCYNAEDTWAHSLVTIKTVDSHKKDKYCVISFPCSIKGSQTHRNRS